MKRHINNDLKQLGQIFAQHNFRIYLVGGAVRNLALGQSPKDYDLTTDAKPEQVMKMFRKVIPTGIKHGTVTVLFRGEAYEITTFRAEGKYSDGRRPDEINYITDLKEDLKRRDFTINSMAICLNTGVLEDPNGGMEDLNKRIIRAIGKAEERFQEDGLRLMRACRFACQLDFTIEPRTLKAIGVTRAKLEHISAERIRDELIKIITAPKPSIGLELLEQTKLLPYVLPELEKAKGVTQHGNHKYDVYYHSLHSCNYAPSENLEVRLAALMHDLGKPLTKKEGDGQTFHFHNHETLGADLAEKRLRQLKFPNYTVKRVVHLIKHHMFHYTPDWTDGAVRRFIARVNPDYLRDLFLLRLADIQGIGGETRNNLAELKERIEQVQVSDAAFRVKDLNISGNDLADKGQIPKGPQMGKVLDFLLETVLEDPSLNTPEKLLEIGTNFYKSRLDIC